MLISKAFVQSLEYINRRLSESCTTQVLFIGYLQNYQHFFILATFILLSKQNTSKTPKLYRIIGQFDSVSPASLVGKIRNLTHSPYK